MYCHRLQGYTRLKLTVVSYLFYKFTAYENITDSNLLHLRL